jgi:nucleotide-binding universal stress UspA family protein
MKLPIIVGTDLTEGSDDALIQAEARATRDGVPLTVVHAMSPLLWSALNDQEQIERLQALMRQQFTALTGRRESEYEVVVERGPAHTVLARLAVAQQALLVVGTHMHHGLGHALLRDVTERVIERARSPVLVTRPGCSSKRILVAVDQPFGASAALDAAVDEVRSSDSKLTAIHIVNTGFVHTFVADIVNGGVYAAHPLGQRSRLHEARQALRTELRRRRVESDVYVVEGEAASLIPQVAARIGAELVVVGTAHRPGRTPLITTAVLRHAPCSVLVIDESAALLSVESSLQPGTG